MRHHAVFGSAQARKLYYAELFSILSKHHRPKGTSHVSVLTFNIFIHIEKFLIVTVSELCPVFLKED